MKIYYFLASFILGCLLFLACNDNPVKPEKEIEKAIIGKITDEDGSTISEVNIHYIFSIGLKLVFKNASIRYSLDSTQEVTLVIYDMFGDEIARPLENQQLQMGLHTYFFDGSKVANGLYKYEVIVKDTIHTKGLFVILEDNITSLIQKPPLTLSDSKGSFQIDYSVLGIGEKIKQNFIEGGNEVVISNEIMIVLQKANYKTLTETVIIDTNKTTNLELVLRK